MTRVTGMEQLTANINALKLNLGEDLYKAVVKGGYAVQRTAVKSIKTKSPGRVVTRYTAAGGEYQHTVSRPGDPPNADTGTLDRSVDVEIMPKVVFVGSTVKYAGELEFGKKRMAARPWLNPALEQNRRSIEKDIAAAVIKQTSKRRPK